MRVYNSEEFCKKFNITNKELEKLETLQVLIPFQTKTGKKFYTETHCVKYVELQNRNNDKDVFSLIDFCNTLNTFEQKYKTEKINKPKQQDLPEPFFSIRKMREIHYNPFAIDTNELFCKEAKILHNLNIKSQVNNQSYFGLTTLLFNKLTNSQITYYIKWRTMIRQNNIPPANKECWLLYLSELINFIEIKDITKTFDRLLELLDLIKNDKLSDYFIKKILIETIKDFWIIHNSQLSLTVKEVKNITKIISEKDILKDFIIKNYELSKEDLNKISSYKIINSIYLQIPEQEELYLSLIPLIFNKIDMFLKENNSSLTKILFNKKITLWKPYIHLNYTFPKNFSIKKIVYSDFEQYYTSSKDMIVKEHFNSYPPDAKKIIGYILKKTEEILRKKTQFKTKITTNKLELSNLYFLDEKVKQLFLNNFIDTIIENTIIEKIKETYKKEYRFNTETIQQIKIVSNNNEEKLIVEDYTKELEEENKKQIKETTILNNLEKEFLQLLLNNDNINNFCKNNNIILDIIIDDINNKLYDIIGDNVIEMDIEPFIYEDYINEIKDILEEEE